MKRGSTYENTPAASRRRQPRKSIEIVEEANSSDSDDLMNPPEESSSEEDPLISKRTSKSQPGQKVLKAVAIPANTPVTSVGARRRVPSSQSPSSIESTLPSTRDHSAEYDTPATSTAATPAEMSNKVSKNVSTSKRKRAGMNAVDADARLAEALQAEEYEDVQTKPAKKSRLSVVGDSNDDESVLSDLPGDDSFDDDVALKSRKPKPAGRASLPSRSARESAKKTITSLRIEDSEEDSMSEFSELNSDDLDDQSESESDDEAVRTIATAVATLDATMPDAEQTTTSVTAPRRRRRGAPGNAAAVAERQANWRRRRIAGLNYRVSRIV